MGLVAECFEVTALIPKHWFFPIFFFFFYPNKRIVLNVNSKPSKRSADVGQSPRTEG